MKDDSVTIINILELLKHAVFVDANKSCDSDDCGEWEEHISCKSNSFGQILARTKFSCWSSTRNVSILRVLLREWFKNNCQKVKKTHGNKTLHFLKQPDLCKKENQNANETKIFRGLKLVRGMS